VEILKKNLTFWRLSCHQSVKTTDSKNMKPLRERRRFDRRSFADFIDPRIPGPVLQPHPQLLDRA